MQKFNYNGNDYELKRTELTGGQVSNLVEESIKIYSNGGMLDGYSFNPVDMEINFYAGLFYLTIEGFDEIDNNEKFEELFSKGVHEYILKNVTNARLAYDLMWKTAKEVGNSVGSILNKINGFLENLPKQEKLDELMDKLPKEWASVKNEYDDIIGKRLPNTEEQE